MVKRKMILIKNCAFGLALTASLFLTDSWASSSVTVQCNAATFAMPESFDVSNDDRFLTNLNEQEILYLSESVASFTNSSAFVVSPKISCEKIQGTKKKSCRVMTASKLCDKPSSEFLIKQIKDDLFIVEDRCGGGFKKYTTLENTSFRKRDTHAWQALRLYLRAKGYLIDGGVSYTTDSVFLVDEKMAYQLQHQVRRGTPIMMQPVLRLPKNFSTAVNFEISIVGWHNSSYWASNFTGYHREFLRYELSTECKSSP